MTYSVEVRNQYGRLVAVLNRPMRKEFTLYRNKPGSCQFTLDAYDVQATPQIIQTNVYDIVFRRLGIPVFAGQISYVDPRIDTSDQASVNIIATGFPDLLQQRMVTGAYPDYDVLSQQLVFSGQDGGTVINTLLNYVQFPINYDDITLMSAAAPNYYQSFSAPGTSTVTTLGLLLQWNGSPTGNVVGEIRTDNNGAPSTTVVPNSQFTIPIANILTNISQTSWQTYTYTGTKPSLSEGATYWIRTVLDSTQGGGNNIGWGVMNNNYYNGRAFSPENTGLFTPDQSFKFFIQLSDNSYQMTENTYLGINPGTFQSSFPIELSLPQYKRDKESIEQISKLHSGIDFNITVQIDGSNIMRKYLNVYYPRQGVDNTSLNFTWPGNITSIGKPKDGKSATNKLYVRGQGSGIFQPVTTSVDPSSVQRYGLREDTEDFSDIPDTTTLQSIGDEAVRVRANPLEVPSIKLDGNKQPFVTSYGLGDTILLRSNGPGFLDFTQPYKIEEIHVIIDDDDKEEVELSVSLA